MKPSAERPLVFVALGTDVHAFPRLISWVQGLTERLPAHDWFVQHGSTSLPTDLQGREFLDPVELDRLFARAAAVVCHGGPGLIMESRDFGHVPVVVPRDPALREHVDGHQQRFARRLATAGTIRIAESPEQFADQLDLVLKRGRPRPEQQPAEVSATVDRFAALVDQAVAARRGRDVHHVMSR